MTIAEPELLLQSKDSNWTLQRWECLPDDGNRYEVIDGVLYMSTSPGMFHEWIIKRLVRLIGVPIEDNGLAYWFTAPPGVLMPGCDPVQPDFILVRQDRPEVLSGRKVQGVPDLIAEVLSPSNPDHDTNVKRGAYARAGVPEYWILRPATQDILVCWQPDPALGDYAQERVLEPDGELISETLPVILAVADLFAGAPNTLL